MSCVLPSDIEKLREDVKKNGGAKYLRSMSSYDRINYFAKFTDTNVGGKITNKTNAEILNRQVEKKMLQPAQTAAIREWLQNLPKDKRINSEARDKDIIDLVRANNAVLDPTRDGEFLQGLARQALGFEASVEDTKKLVEKADTAAAARDKFIALVPKYTTTFNVAEAQDLVDATPGARDAYNQARDALLEFKDVYDFMSIKAKTGATPQQIKDAKVEIAKLLKGEQTEKLIKRAGDWIYRVAGTLKATKASMDLSATFKQLGALWLSDPKSAARASWEGVKTLGRALKTGDGRRAALGELMMRPNALNGNYARLGLEIGIKEEAFPENVWEKIKDKGIGKLARFITATDDAFSMSLQVGRAERFDTLWDAALADLKGNSDAVFKLFEEQKIGKKINEITGRGELPIGANTAAERVVNVSLFSPRWAMSRLAMITNLRYLFMGEMKHINPFAKATTPNGMAAKASVNLFYGIALLQTISYALRTMIDDEEPEKARRLVFNPTSAEFGQLKIGDLRTDLTFGMASLVRAIARSFSGQTITSEGVKKETTASDVWGRWLGSKKSPLAQEVMYTYRLLFSKDPVDFNYEPLTWGKLATELAPISSVGLGGAVAAYYKGNASEGNQRMTGWLLDMVGLSSQYWGVSEKNIGKSAALLREQERLAYKTNRAVKSLKAAKNAAINTKLTGAKRDRANREFEQNLSRALDRLIGSAAYKRMTDAQRNEAMGKIRTEEQRKIKKKYGIK